MTYCVAAVVDEGLVFVSDSRTNYGPDQLGTYSKMRHFFGDGARSFVVLSAGNLATTQATVMQLERDIRNGIKPNLSTVADLDEGAECVGLASVNEQRRHPGPGHDFLPEATFIFGGQIRGQAPGIYLVHREGNFVRASDTSPYLQIGEVKYGKPILDRIMAHDRSLSEVAKCLLVSMDSTMRSNATVGPPIEVTAYRAGTMTRGDHVLLDENDPYLIALHDGWGERIKVAFEGLPTLDDTGPAITSATCIDQ